MGYGPYDPTEVFGYAGGRRPQKTDWCCVCDSRRPRGGGVTWRGHFVCASCAKAHRPVTFHATWSELVPTEEAEAIAVGDVMEEPDWTRQHEVPQPKPGLPVTRVDEWATRFGHDPETHVYLSDRDRTD